MDRRAFAVSSLLALPAIAATSNQDQSPAKLQAAHEAWVLATLRQMLTIKPGMTRGDLTKLFSGEGGIQDRTKGTFYSRACMFFRVDVEFDVNAATAPALASPQDRISRISRPYLREEIRID